MLTALWRWLVSVLVWLSADPQQLELEHARSAAAVHLAAATLRRDATPPTPPPAPQECACGGTCVNGQWKPDGKIVMPCPCPKACKCKSKGVSSASPAG